MLKETENVNPSPSTSSLPSSPSSSSSSSSTTNRHPTTDDSSSISEKNVYRVKWIVNSQRVTPIITQNENGPCPLISIVNVLSLRGRNSLELKEGCDFVEAERLLQYVGDVILQSVPKNISIERRLDYEANVNDAIAVLQRMQSGLDVNVKFTGVKLFEYTPECIVFDLLNISLYHGWLTDPNNDADVCSVIKELSYNQLVEKIIADKNSEESDLVRDSLIAQQFLESSASQLTYHGLCELNSAMTDGEIGVFFRNNHFSTIIKHNNELYLLVTDQGFLKEPKVVWETLDSVDGDVLFVNDSFQVVPLGQSSELDVKQVPLTQELQIDQDHLLAMSLQEESGQSTQQCEDAIAGMSDEEIAIKLQKEEYDVMNETQPKRDLGRRVSSANGGHSGSSKKCIIL